MACRLCNEPTPGPYRGHATEAEHDNPYKHDAEEDGMGSNTNDPMGLCGRGSGCFVTFDGVHHNPTWHRLQEVEAERRTALDDLDRVQRGLREIVGALDEGVIDRDDAVEGLRALMGTRT